MAQPPNIHRHEGSPRLHYIVEWAKDRNLKQADIVRALGVDKGTVSRWFDGILPSEYYLVRLAALFFPDDPEPDVAALFRHPDDDWMFRLLHGRPKDERDRIKATIELAFPRRPR